MKLARVIITQACEENRPRDSEIMQGVDGEKAHAADVAHWVKKLTKNPSVALQISALLHDIDRVVNPEVGGGFKGSRKSKSYLEHKKAHAKRSADFACTKLFEHGVDEENTERVRFLISHHDDTGEEIEKIQDKELDVLVGADSLAFFTSIAPRLYEKEGERRIKDKIEFMIEKMPSKVRQILIAQKLENSVFDRLKKEVFVELKS